MSAAAWCMAPLSLRAPDAPIHADAVSVGPAARSAACTLLAGRSWPAQCWRYQQPMPALRGCMPRWDSLLSGGASATTKTALTRSSCSGRGLCRALTASLGACQAATPALVVAHGRGGSHTVVHHPSAPICGVRHSSKTVTQTACKPNTARRAPLCALKPPHTFAPLAAASCPLHMTEAARRLVQERTKQRYSV